MKTIGGCCGFGSKEDHVQRRAYSGIDASWREGCVVLDSGQNILGPPLHIFYTWTSSCVGTGEYVLGKVLAIDYLFLSVKKPLTHF